VCGGMPPASWRPSSCSCFSTVVVMTPEAECGFEDGTLRSLDRLLHPCDKIDVAMALKRLCPNRYAAHTKHRAVAYTLPKPAKCYR
jgi:hypothetical protein